MNDRFDERAHAGAEHLDKKSVEGYDRKQGYPDPEQDLAAFSANGLTSASTIIDFGAGTGQFAIPAAKEFRRVIAVDISPAMLESLRLRLQEDGASNVTCVQAGFLTYRHDGDLVDGIYTRNALHHLPDFWKAIALLRMYTVMKEGGILRIRDLVYDFEPEVAGDVFEGWLAGAADDPRVGYTAEDYAEHVRGEFSTFRWMFEPILEHAGFEILEAAFAGRVFGSYTCVKRNRR